MEWGKKDFKSQFPVSAVAATDDAAGPSLVSPLGDIFSQLADNVPLLCSPLSVVENGPIHIDSGSRRS